MPKMGIKIKILLVLLALVGMVSVSLIFSQYYFSKKIAIQSTDHTFHLISQNITEHLKRKSLDIRRILNTSVNNKGLLEPITFEVNHPVFHDLVEILQFKQQFHAIYFAQKSGAYYEVINMHNRPKMHETFNAPKGTEWLVITVIDDIHQHSFLNSKFGLLEQKKFRKKYNPLARHWYIKALSVNRVVSIKPYFFALTQKMGVTFAKAVRDQGMVLAIDYTMDQLNTILANQKYDAGSEVFIVDEEGKRYASSILGEGEHIDREAYSASVLKDQAYFKTVLSQHLNEIVKYKEGKRNYFLRFHPLLSKNSYLGIKVDADKMLKPHRDNLAYSLLIAVLLLSLAIPVILYSAESIAKPIRLLREENEKIKIREYAEVKKIDTNILELDELSASLVSLSGSIQAHEKSQEALLDAIIKLIAEAIDNKSPYTGKHCERVPEIALLLLDAANSSESKHFKDFELTSKEALREFEIGAWLHDCGKVTTPVFVVDKAVKLETIYNRIHEIRTRFEVLWRDAQIACLKGEIDEETLRQREQKLLDDFEFIAMVNLGSEFMDEKKKARVKEIAAIRWERHFDDRLGLGEDEKRRYTPGSGERLPVKEFLLSDKAEHKVVRENFDHEQYIAEGFKLDVPEYLYDFGEVYNLCVEKGTLTEEERFKINEHVIMSIKMLEKIPFPESMSHIVEYAGTHHETLAGTGYPRKLSGEELSIPARIMAIADIFEALTASDRPYKKAKRLSEALKIMSFMVKDAHIDAALFELFLRSGVYRTYAERYLEPEQIDEIDIEKYL